jgi:hypothetical protein
LNSGKVPFSILYLFQEKYKEFKFGELAIKIGQHFYVTLLSEVRSLGRRSSPNNFQPSILKLNLVVPVQI